MFEDHLEETKRLIEEKAKTIMLDEGDLQFDKGMFSAIRQRLNNVIISDHLTDLANDRLENFNLLNNGKLYDEYRQELIKYLPDIIRKYM